jgi:hypothetical protein
MTHGNGHDTDPDGTEPAPKDPEGKLSYQIAELELATYRVGELLSDVKYTLSLLRLAMRTEEHRLNKVQDAAEAHGAQLANHEGRLASLETRPSTAAE